MIVFLLIICLYIVFSSVVINAAKKEKNKKDKLRTFYHQAETLRSLAEDAYQEADRANSVDDFIYSWDAMIGYLEEMKKYDGPLTFTGATPDLVIESKKKEFQWKLRDAIERNSKKSKDLIKKKYRNSSEHKLYEYQQLCSSIQSISDRLSDETKDFSNEVIEDVYRALGLSVPPIVLFPENNSRESLHSSQTAKSTDVFSAVDVMDGRQFEYWCADLLRKNGFQKVSVTQGSGDQGVDVLAEKNGIRYAFQCKCYSGLLSNKPIQEIHAGKDIYNCHVGVVMTNSYFTPGAIEAAERTNTLLWDRDYVEQMARM